MGGNGNRRVVDSTPIVCSRSYCAAVMKDPNRGCCPVRPEGDPMRVKCEGEVLGRNSAGKIGPRWVYKGNGRVEAQPGNPFLAWAYGNGWVGACSNISPVCNWKEVINHPVAGPASGSGGYASPSNPPAANPPGTTPPGTTPPGTTPPTTPSPGEPAPPIPAPGGSGCLLPMGPDNFLEMNVHEMTTARGRALNLTAKWCGDPASMPIAGYNGRCGTKCCILGVDGGPMGGVCERALVGTPRWTGTTPFDQNPFLAHPARGATVCSGNYPRFCSAPTP